ncbi:hypothetical protein IW261DRAFT_1420723 [Armillaria novae-zelandiae]|uniref:Uncharacterized protein n=1 Tax=Armillaria novae-zelandiae TaxID=153914 RepID=A0AA39P6L8_9AGAR|nr:hypothetical protein IW261DRAFT_1420723 [Armillaria novae-zelandiae]
MSPLLAFLIFRQFIATNRQWDSAPGENYDLRRGEIFRISQKDHLFLKSDRHALERNSIRNHIPITELLASHLSYPQTIRPINLKQGEYKGEYERFCQRDTGMLFGLI